MDTTMYNKWSSYVWVYIWWSFIIYLSYMSNRRFLLFMAKLYTDIMMILIIKLLNRRATEYGYNSVEMNYSLNPATTEKVLNVFVLLFTQSHQFPSTRHIISSYEDYDKSNYYPFPFHYFDVLQTIYAYYAYIRNIYPFIGVYWV
jgi:hypothetical protein